MLESHGGRVMEKKRRVFEASLVGRGQFWICHSPSPVAKAPRGYPLPTPPRKADPLSLLLKQY